MKKIAILILALLLVFVLGCGNEATNSESGNNFAVITDDLGREVELAKKPERIAVTSASFLEALHSVGGDVVARPDSKTKMPDFAKDKISIGKVYQINTEALVAAAPDLVIINKGMNEKLVDTLDASGIKSLVISAKTYDEVKNEINIFAKITGETERGAALIKDMDEKIAATKAKIPAESKKIMIIHSTNQGLTVQLKGSIAGDVADILGWENLAAGDTPLENNPDAAPYSLETLLAKNPEILFITSMGDLDAIKANMEQMMADNPAWQSLDAVKNNRVYYLPQDLFLLSPDIHYPEAVETMAKLVYPESFND